MAGFEPKYENGRLLEPYWIGGKYKVQEISGKSVVIGSHGFGNVGNPIAVARSGEPNTTSGVFFKEAEPDEKPVKLEFNLPEAGRS